MGLGYKVLLALAVFIGSLLVAKFVRRSVRRANDRFERFDATLVPVCQSLLSYLVYAVGTVIVLDIFGVNTNSLIALLGAAGLAIGLALKDTLQNIAAGIMLLFLRPFRVGEFIECGSMAGTVKEINLFTTILETLDGLYISAPNGGIWGNAIKNYTCNGKRRLDIVVGIAYGDSIDAGFSVLRRLIGEESRFMQDPPPQVMVQSMGDSSVNLMLRGWTSVDDYWDVFWDLNKRVKEGIEAEGLSIPFPQQDVHIVSTSKAA